MHYERRASLHLSHVSVLLHLENLLISQLTLLTSRSATRITNSERAVVVYYGGAVFIRRLFKDVESAGEIMRSRESSHLNVLETMGNNFATCPPNRWRGSRMDGTASQSCLQVSLQAQSQQEQVARMSLLISPCVCLSVFCPHVTAQGLLNRLS